MTAFRWEEEGVLLLLALVFLFSFVLAAPADYSLTSPANDSNLSDSTLTLSWANGSDPDGGPLVYYLEVATDFGFTGFAYVNDSIAEEESPTEDTTSALADGLYFWRVLASNTTDNGTFTAPFSVRVDTVSPVVILESHPNGTAINSTSSPLTFSYRAEDAQLTNCTLYGDFGGTWTANETKTSAHAASLSFTSFALREGLYAWNVECADGANNRAFNDSSANLSLLVDATPPTAFNLTTPTDDAAFNDTTPQLAWTETTELNLVNYTVEISRQPLVEPADFAYLSQDASFNNYTTPLASGVWYWRVTASDGAGNFYRTEIIHFTVNPTQTDTPNEETPTSEPGGGSSPTIKKAAVDILQPGGISVITKTTITTPLVVRNTGDTLLEGIILTATADKDDVHFTFAPSSIPNLAPGQESETQLSITSLRESLGAREVTVTADIRTPRFTDTSKFFINLIELGAEKKERVLERLQFFLALLEENPECLELEEAADRVRSLVEAKDYEGALALVEKTIQACESLVGQRAETVELPKEKDSRQTALLVAAELLAAAVVFGMLYRSYRRRKPSLEAGA